MADVAPVVELYGTAVCPYTSELREHLLWNGVSFREFDIDADMDARIRLAALIDGVLSVPVLVENGRVKEMGWRGRSCLVGDAGHTPQP